MVMILMAMKSLVLNLETLGISDEWFWLGAGALCILGVHGPLRLYFMQKVSGEVISPQQGNV